MKSNKKKKSIYQSAEYFKDIADKYNSLAERSNRVLNEIYASIKENSAKGNYSIGYDITYQYIYDKECFDNVQKILKDSGFSVYVDTTNIYMLQSQYANSLGSRYIDATGDKAFIKIEWKYTKKVPN